LKPDLPACSYHVTTRTAHQRFLFTDEVKDTIIVPWLERLARVFYVDVASDVVMTNHTHALVRVYKPPFDLEDLRRRYELLQSFLAYPNVWAPRKAAAFYKRITDLSCFMQAFNWRVAHEYNKKYGLWGHVWGARFRSRVVEGPPQEQLVDSYIQQNPVRASMVDKPSDYRWSTCGRAKDALEKGRLPITPTCGMFRRIDDHYARAGAYIAYQDYLSDALQRRWDPTMPPPAQVVALCIDETAVEATCAALRARKPAVWNRRVYGSEAFASQITDRTKPPP